MKAILQEILDRVPEALGAAVVGLDGIAVEKLVARSSFNIELALAEWVGLVRRASASMRSQAISGEPQEISVASDSQLAILRSIGGDYYLCLFVGADCIAGRARYEAWRAGVQLEQVFA